MDQQRRLAVSIDDDAINMAWVAEDGHLTAVEKWPITRFSTLTDALLAYEKTTGVRLLGTACALSVLGATYGETMMLSRGNWAISRSGLRSMFGRDAIILNDVAARAWAALGGVGPKLESLSTNAIGTPDFKRRGRWALTKVDAGVGLAVIDVDDAGLIRVLECEMGHCAFAPNTDEDRVLATALSRTRGLVSWEMVLTLSPEDPIWSTPGLPGSRSQRVAMLARLVGFYVGDTVMAHGAWTGAILTGRRIAEMVTEPVMPSFNSGFENKPKFQRLIKGTPRWRLVAQDLTLSGCAIALARHATMLGATNTVAAY